MLDFMVSVKEVLVVGACNVLAFYCGMRLGNAPDAITIAAAVSAVFASATTHA